MKMKELLLSVALSVAMTLVVTAEWSRFQNGESRPCDVQP